MLTLRNIVAVFLLTMVTALAGQEHISVDSKVDKSTIRIGDLITYTVTVTHTPEVSVMMPELAANLGSFEVRDYEVHEPTTEDGLIKERVDYVISTFEVGEFEIPPLTFYYTVADDSTRQELSTRKIKIVVESLKPSEAGDIRDIKPPLSLPRDYRNIFLWGSIIFAFLVLVGVSFYIWRKRRTGKGLLPEKVEPPRPAHEIALEKLEQVKQSSLLQEGRIKEFYVEISEIIRQYVEGRYFIIALEMTSADVIGELRKAEIEENHIDLFQKFLEKCDLVKFAKYKPAKPEIASDLDQAFQIIEQTKLIYDEQEPEDAFSEEDAPAEKEPEPSEAKEVLEAESESVK